MRIIAIFAVVVDLDGIFAVLEKNRLMFVVLSIVECGHFEFHELLNQEAGPPEWGKKYHMNTSWKQSHLSELANSSELAHFI